VKHIIFDLFVIFCLIAFTSCTTTQIIVPPVTAPPTQVHLSGKFVWYDLLSDNVIAAKKFYGELFGWEFEGEHKPDAKYTIIKHNGAPIGGIVYAEDLGRVNGSQWLSYISVENVDEAVGFVQKSRGKVHREPFEFPDRGRVAVVTDPQGALLVLIKAEGGDPADKEPVMNEWLWTELFTSDLDAAASFYEKLVGYKAESFDSGVNVPYYVFRKRERPEAGMLRIPWENVRPNWLPYVKVADPAAVAKKAKALGGTVIVSPSADIRNGSVGLIADPTGGVVAVQKWPR
jgi:predicted enzyme related to lactoylglutathione lyase